MLGLALAALAHAEEALRAVVAHREHEVLADEDRHLAAFSSSPWLQFGQLHHDEQRVPYSSIFGPLVAVARILDGEFVQVELLLHLKGHQVTRQPSLESTRAVCVAVGCPMRWVSRRRRSKSASASARDLIGRLTKA
jgi:hypothetical protein